MSNNGKRDTVSLELLVFVLAGLLVWTFLQKIALTNDVEELTQRIEEFELSSSGACSYCDDHDYEHIFCKICDTHFPIDFAFEYYDDLVCPECVYEGYLELTSPDTARCAECCTFYERKWGAGYGLCEDCGSELLDYCDFCIEMEGKYVADIGYVVCLDCLSHIVTEMELLPYIDKWAEG